MIIGITGTIGAGKGTIVDYLVNKKNFIHYSVREFLIEEIKKRGMIVNRDSMVIVANSLRSKYSPAYIIEELYKKGIKSGKNVIIESIRALGEVESLREKPNFYLFAIDALPEIRYDRITQRQSETDNISYQTFLENEAREMSSEDPTKQNLKKCIQLADYVIINDKDIEDLQNKVENILQEISEKK